MITDEQYPKIHSYIYAFMAFISLTLYQTSTKNLGTILAFSSIALTFLLVLKSRTLRILKITVANFLMVTGIAITLFLSTLTVGFPSGGARLLAQVFLFIILSQVKINCREAKAIKSIYELAMIIYSIALIYSCMNNARYYHGDISLFGTSFDPNYIGIPIIAASSMLLYDFLHERKKIIFAVGYVITVVAIVYTASRGNMIGLLVGGILILWFYFKNRNVSNSKRIFMFALAGLLLSLLIYFFSRYFPDQWLRMTNISASTDNGRFSLWSRALDVWRNHPIFGVGLGGMYKLYGMASHNTYMQVLSETGTFGALLFVVFVVSHLKKIYALKNKVYFCISLAMMAQIMFLDAIDNRGVWTILCILILAENTITENTNNEDPLHEV